MCPPYSLYDTFISHNHVDKDVARFLAGMLTKEGLYYFLDERELVAGTSLPSELAQALEKSASFACLLGPSGIGGYQRFEIDMAVDRRTRDDSFRIIVVVLPDGDGSNVPTTVGYHLRVDFSNGFQDAAALRQLFDGVRGNISDRQTEQQLPPTYRSMAPPIDRFVQRSEYADLVELLVQAADEGDTPTRVCLTTALRGAGGFGKTALAQAICEDPTVRGRFPAGILWTTLGQELTEADRLARVLDLIRWWIRKEPPGFESVEAAAAHLRQVLSGRPVLLVVDDLWQAMDFSPFNGISPPAALLVTTRNSRSLPVHSKPILVDALAVHRAVELLAHDLPTLPPDGRLRRLAQRLGEWPILLRLVNAQLREEYRGGVNSEIGLDLVEEQLDRAGLTAFDRDDEEARNLAVRRTVEASLCRLSPTERFSYGKMAVFVEDEQVPLAILELLWDLPPSEVYRQCRRLAEMSLLYRFDASGGWVQVHDVIRSYLVRKHEPEIRSFHASFADRLCLTDRANQLPPLTEQYFLSRFPYHLNESGRTADLEDLVFSYPWLARKMTSGDVSSVLGDFDLLNGMPDALSVQQALRLSLPVLVEDRDQLASHLYGRLSGIETPRVSALLASALDQKPLPWIKPLSASLQRPTGPMQCSLQAHSGPVVAIAGLDDEMFVSGSTDGLIRTWQLASGRPDSTFSDGSSGIRCLARVNGTRVLAASEDGITRLWEVTGGHVVRRFVGHAAPVTSLCVREGHFLSGSEDGTLLHWSVESEHPLGSFVGHTSRINGVVYLDDQTIVSIGADRTLRAWDLTDGHEIRAVTMPVFAAEVLAALDPNEVVVADFAGQVQVWQPISTDTTPHRSFSYDAVGVRALCMLDRDLGVSTVGGYSRIRLWEPRRSEVGPEVHVPGTAVCSLAKLGSTHLLCGNEDGAISAWSIEALRTIQDDTTRGSVFAVAAIDATTAASTSDRSVRIWHVPDGSLKRILEGHNETVNAICVMPPDRIASSSSDSTIRIWNPHTGRLLQTLAATSKVSAMAVIQGAFFVAAPTLLVGAPLDVGKDLPLYLWELSTGRPVGQIPVKGHGVSRALTTRDGGLLLATYSGMILHFDISDNNSRRRNFVLSGHERSVQALAELEDHTIASGGMESSIRLWDLATRQTVRILEGHSRAVTGLAALSANVLASASTDRTIRLWDLRTNGSIVSLRADTGFSSLAAMPDGRTLVAGDEGGGVHFLECRLSTN